MNARVQALTGRGRARRAANGSAAEGAARAGLTARGVIYLLVGILALQIAFGSGNRQADRGGALEELADSRSGPSAGARAPLVHGPVEAAPSAALRPQQQQGRPQACSSAYQPPPAAERHQRVGSGAV
ncbi:hypothetical protein STENM223S_04048 [Streptomyces tendae]